MKDIEAKAMRTKNNMKYHKNLVTLQLSKEQLENMYTALQRSLYTIEDEREELEKAITRSDTIRKIIIKDILKQMTTDTEKQTNLLHIIEKELEKFNER